MNSWDVRPFVLLASRHVSSHFYQASPEPPAEHRDLRGCKKTLLWGEELLWRTEHFRIMSSKPHNKRGAIFVIYSIGFRQLLLCIPDVTELNSIVDCRHLLLLRCVCTLVVDWTPGH